MCAPRRYHTQWDHPRLSDLADPSCISHSMGSSTSIGKIRTSQTLRAYHAQWDHPLLRFILSIPAPRLFFERTIPAIRPRIMDREDVDFNKKLYQRQHCSMGLSTDAFHIFHAGPTIFLRTNGIMGTYTSFEKTRTSQAPRAYHTQCDIMH